MAHKNTIWSRTAQAMNTGHGATAAYLRGAQVVAQVVPVAGIPIAAGLEVGIQGTRYMQHKTGIAKHGTLFGGKVPQPKVPRAALNLAKTEGRRAVKTQIVRVLR